MDWGLLDHFFGAGTDLISKPERFHITEAAKELDANRNPEATTVRSSTSHRFREHSSNPVCKEVAHSILHKSLNPALFARYKESCQWIGVVCLLLYVSPDVISQARQASQASQERVECVTQICCSSKHHETPFWILLILLLSKDLQRRLGYPVHAI